MISQLKQQPNFFLEPAARNIKNMTNESLEPGLFKDEYRCTQMFCLCSKTYCCYDSISDKYKFSSKNLNKRTLEGCCDGPMEKYRNFWISSSRNFD